MLLLNTVVTLIDNCCYITNKWSREIFGRLLVDLLASTTRCFLVNLSIKQASASLVI